MSTIFVRCLIRTASRASRCRALTAAIVAGGVLASCGGLRLAAAQPPGTGPAAGAAAAPAAEEPSGADDRQFAIEVRQLVRQLNDTQLTARDEAEQKLLGFGPKALVALPVPDEGMPEEVKHRLERIRSKLERVAAEAAVEASRVTLEGSFPLSQLLADVQTQTGNEIVDLRARFGQPAPDPNVKVSLKDVAFWPAIDEILDTANLNVYPFSGEKGLGIVARAEGDRPRRGTARYAGPLRIEAVRIEAMRDLRREAGQAMRLQFEVAWEPRLAPIAITQRLAEVEAIDDRDQPLKTAAQVAELEAQVQDGTTAVEMVLPFALPERGATKIARLGGTLRAIVPGRIETFEFPNVDQVDATAQRQAGVQVIAETVRQNNELWEVRVRVAFGEVAGALESHRGWIYKNDCHLRDPDGKRIEYAGFETTRQTDTEVGLAFLFEREEGLKNCTLVYSTPAAIVNLPLEYELVDIPLP